MFIRKLVPIVATLLVSTNAAAITNSIYEFTVIRNGATFFHDTFSDGLEPPSSPLQSSGLTGCGTQCYTVGSVFPDGSESGNRLQLDSTLGVDGNNAAGVPVRTQRATLSLSTTPGPTGGLQAIHTYSVSGLFDFVIPGAGENYTIALTDRATGHPRNDDITIQVANPSGLTPLIRFRRQDFVSNTATVIDSVPVSASDGDQIRLILSHPTADTNSIVASYEFFKAGVSQGIVQLAGSADIYNGEIWTRPEFRVAMAIPEPETYALMLAGLGVVVYAARRRKRI